MIKPGEEAEIKKLARFKFIEEKFGKGHVLEYYACYDFNEICAAAEQFEARNLPWNLRTDTHSSVYSLDQAILAPFIFLCDKEKARKVWEQYGKSLVYIVFRSMPLCFLNGVAIKIDSESVFIEYNEAEQDIPQRFMYEHPDFLSHMIISTNRRSVWQPEIWPGPAMLPYDESATRRRFDEVYELLLSSGETEMTFALRQPDKQVIIW